MDCSNHKEELELMIRTYLGDGPLVGAEIGVDIGHLAYHLLNNMSDLKLYCVDPWQFYKEYDDLLAGDQATFERRYSETLNRLSVFRERAVVLRCCSTSADLEQLDFVFIDANHSYESVIEDVHYWWPRLRAGGMLFGHDFSETGVNKAITEFTEQKNISLLQTGEHACWAIRKEESNDISKLEILDKTVYEWYYSSRKFLFCIQCQKSIEYLNMALLCVMSMRANGITEPVVFMMDEALSKKCAPYKRFRKMGISVMITHFHIRQWNYGLMFEQNTDIDFLVNIDCDQYFYKYSLDFRTLLDKKYHMQMFQKINWENEFGIDVLKTRNNMFYNSPDDVERLFGRRWESYERHLESPQRWVWGNLVIVHRSILDTKFWDIITKFGFIYPDDEGAYMFARFIEPETRIRYLTDEDINQYIGPLTIIDEEPDNHCLVHYAGPIWKEESQAVLNRLYETCGNH